MKKQYEIDLPLLKEKESGDNQQANYPYLKHVECMIEYMLRYN